MKFNLNIKKLSALILFTSLLLTQSKILGQNNISEKTCVECHQRTVKNSILHGPVATDCKVCHLPTGKKHPQDDVEGFTLLKQGSDLCYSCHKDTHDKIEKDKHKHPPVAKGECLECHEVHSSNNPKLIFTNSPDLCYFCHNKLEKLIKKSKVVHLPVTEKGGCIGCHSPHSSPEKRMLVSNGKTLCLSCHDKTIEKGDRKIANIAKIVKNSKVLHKALKKRCTSCHTPHATDNSFLLKFPYPTQNYAPASEETYALCFQCHDIDLLLLKTTESATEFRDGDRNLHYVHVNKQKGRTCINCHNVHGAPGEHLIPKTVKFGSWDMPLVYIPLENGGSCKGCHEKRTYLRKK